MIASPRMFRLHGSFIARIMLMWMALVSASFCSGKAFVEIPVPHTTLVVFTDHHMDDDQWAALVTELRRSQIVATAKIPVLSGDFEVLRGEYVVPGLRVENGISVFLRGDCSLWPAPRHPAEGALGWVPLANGRIQPFIYVDCSRIADMLDPLVLGMHRERRNTVMAEAVARVVLHEWIHFATQTVSHGRRGITQSQFNVRDLLAEDTEFGARLASRREKKRQSGL